MTRSDIRWLTRIALTFRRGWRAGFLTGGRHILLIWLAALLLSQPMPGYASAPAAWQSPTPARIAAMPALISAQSPDPPTPPESLIGALLGRYAFWLMLVACSSMLALLGAAAIVTRMRRIAGDE